MSDESTQTTEATQATIRVAKNGPLIVKGPVRLEGADGEAWTDVPEGTNVALCRCGLSKLKPFCDGAHAAAGFESEPTSQDQPFPW